MLLNLKPKIAIIDPESIAMDYKLYDIKLGDRLDIIAYNFYGDSEKWVDIANFNGITFFDLLPGYTIKIPKLI